MLQLYGGPTAQNVYVSTTHDVQTSQIKTVNRCEKKTKTVKTI